MGSRRTTTRSISLNGKSSNGDNTSGISRPGGCSYISNVRPENRSTFCSVMAQLTEETQPSFETTLKSKAVSENCNVKFSCVVTGHPAPQITWYKDDMQLDRYCGLPKYEIFRNGQHNSLHIYNCTVEDAAIYQASAINSKGIVSCSGVLEVGEMNEFKIHQRYFAKLKQKAEHQRKITEGIENQALLRTISPDRTLRKRRSTMEAFRSMPSSMEDESNEESHRAVAIETEVKMQKATEERVEEKPVTNGQVVNENGIQGGTHVNDAAHTIFTSHQPKTPFVKKKIKISNAKNSKADTLRERPSEVRRAKDETLGVFSCTDSIKSIKKTSEEIPKVEKKSGSRIVDSSSRNVTEHRTSATHDAAKKPVERRSKDERICVVSPKTEQLTVSPTVFTSGDPCVLGTEGNRFERPQNERGHKDTEGNLEKRKQFPNLYLSITSSQQQSNVDSTRLSKLKEGINKTDNATAMNTDERPDNSTVTLLVKGDLKSVDTQYGSRAASSVHPCEQAGDPLLKKEKSPYPKSVSENKPVLSSEVTQAHTKMNWHDAPVNLKLPFNESKMDVSTLQKTKNVDVQTQSLHCALQAATDNITQDKWDHSRESHERRTVFYTDRQKSPMESGDGENNTECNVSPLALQSQVDPTMKAVEETEVQVDDKVEDEKVSELLLKADNMVPNHIVEMEFETAALHMVEKTRDAVDNNTDIANMEASCKEKNETLSKESCSKLQNIKSNISDSAMPNLKSNPEHINTQQQTTDFKEITKPELKVISVAELLRSQIKALDLSLENSASTVPFHDDSVQERTTTAAEAGQRLRTEVKKSVPDRKSETITDEAPPTNIKATLLEVYHQLNKTLLHIEPVHSSQKNPLHETMGLKNNDDVDISQETVISHLDLLTESQNGKHTHLPSTCQDKLANRTPQSDPSGFVSQGSRDSLKVSGQESKVAVLKHTQDEPAQGKDMEMESALEIKLNGKSGRGSTEINFAQCNIKDQNSLPIFPTQNVFSLETPEKNPQLLQSDSSMVEEFSRNDSLTSPTLEGSPLLKKRDCVSPIPSATPQELAAGARRKILVPKAKPDEATEATSPTDNQDQKKEVSTQNSKLSISPVSPSTSPSLSRQSPLLQPPGERTAPVEKRSPLLNRRKTTLEAQAPSQQSTEKIHDLQTGGKPTEKLKHDPFKAPQVIRKIRGETFADASGHIKLWCQFFNVLSVSTITWYKNEEEIVQITRNAGDETQVNLAIVQASCRDTGVYRCSITNEYGTDSTDTLLSAEILAGMSLREDLGVGEEIEMTPLLFSKGVADSGTWGNKLFGRVMMQESHIGDGCSHKVWRAKVIYGLEPVFESGDTCIIKVRNPIAYGGKGESCLAERNLDIIKQECKIQNLAREYCKIFTAEVRGIENFGPSLEVVPVYLMYRPANTVPYATVEADLTGPYQKFCDVDHTGRKNMRTGSVAEQKCYAMQHWIFQWTNGNLLLTRLEGVDTKITNVGISVKSTGHQGLPVEGNPKVFEHFVSQHQCNYFCGLLGLRSLKVIDSLSTPTKLKGSKSPLLQRKSAAGSPSPQMGRKASGSPRLPKKSEQDGRNTPSKEKAADALKVVKIT